MKSLKKIFCFLIALIFTSSILQGDDEKPKIYDGFLFFNEFEILEIRLNELYEHVDYFVLVEASETFTGLSKPMYFAENQERFAQFADKIIYVPVHDSPTIINSAWDREHFQRRQIARGLSKCTDTDIILISDVDEIIRGEKLQKFIAPIQNEEALIVFAGLKMHRYFLNRFDPVNTPWAATAATTYKSLKRLGADAIRAANNDRQYPLIDDMGWHFTQMGGPDMIRSKIESFSHTECNTPDYKSSARIRRDATGSWLVDIDESYPLYIRQNRDFFERSGYIDSVTEAPNR